MSQEQENLNSLNEELLTDESQLSNSKIISIRQISLIPFIIGIFIVALGLIDMVVLYAIPFYKIQKNKKKFPDATFAKPSTALIAIHFCLHVSVIIFGVFIILLSFGYSFLSINSISYLELVISATLILIFFFVQIYLGFTYTEDPKSKVDIEQIIKYANNEAPSNFAFIYSNDIIEVPNCVYNPKVGQYQCKYQSLWCFSDIGIKVPLISKLTSAPYDFSNSPDMFNFNIEQVMNMTEEYSTKFYHILDEIDKCDEFNKDIDYYPLIAGSYIVTNGNIPVSLSHGTRVASILLGVGIYYELYTKSVPNIKYRQYINIDLDSSYDYDNILEDDTCILYGKCSVYNNKPVP